MKRTTNGGKRPAVSKLLRVLVAGGMALAGAASPLEAAAEDKPTPEKTDKTAPGKPGAKGAADQAASDRSAPGQGGDKKDGQKKEEPRSDDAGGVKGW